jgi:DNA-binding response OmpR family regulator
MSGRSADVTSTGGPSGPGTAASHDRPERWTILVVDDEPGIVDVLQLGLSADDVRVVAAGDVAGGLSAMERDRPDLVLLDVGLPGGDGFGLLRRIREISDVPVVMLTARGDVRDRVTGLESGADDYVAKPFDLEELVARVHAHLRRRRRDVAERSIPTPWVVGDLVLDPASRRARRGGRSLDLTAREFDLLAVLVGDPGRLHSKMAILEQVWGYAYDPNLVEVYVGYLRRKLGEPPMIETVRGHGYRIVAAPPAEDAS